GWLPLTRVLPLARPRVRRPRLRAVVAAALGLLVLGAAVWFATAVGPPDRPVAVSEPPAAAVPVCAVKYQLTADDGHALHATITATNTGGHVPAGWRLTVQLPEASAAVVPAVGWEHEGSTITSPPQATLPTGESAQLVLAASHAGAAPLPT